MKQPLFVFLCFFSIVVYAQNSLDSTWGTNGIVTHQTAYGSSIADIVLNISGQITTIGTARTNDDHTMEWAIVQYNQDGSLSPNFGLNGEVILDFSPHDDIATDGILQTDGKLLVAGFTFNADSATYDFAMARYMKTGVLDYTFGNNGIVIIPTYKNYYIQGRNVSIALQADNKIVLTSVVTSNTQEQLYIGRYQTNGLIDSTFGTNGYVNLAISPFILHTSVAIDNSQNIIVGFVNNFTSLGIIRLLSNGNLDYNFNGNGIVFTPISVSDAFENTELQLQNDGKIVLFGNAYDTIGTNSLVICRYTVTGLLDSTFNQDGIINGYPFMGTSLCIQSDNKILVVGNKYINSTQILALTRYQTDGSLDSTFGNNGLIVTDLQGDEAIEKVVLTSSNEILVGGFFQSYSLLAKYKNYIEPTSISQFNNSDTKIWVYPNPISDNFMLYYQSLKREKISITLEDINGTFILLLGTEVMDKQKKNVKELKLPSNLSKGIYILSVHSESYKYTTKIIKE